jgi:small subunit ribosomal protein S9
VTTPEENNVTESTEAPLTEAISTDAVIVDETPAADAPAAEAPAAPAAEAPAAPAAEAPAAPAAPAPATKARAAKGAKGSHLTQTVGRRKEAIVRVRLVPGTGTFTLNGRTLESYFPNKLHQQLIREPLVITERTEAYDVFANLRGGGITGQAGALRLAVARALIDVNPDDRPALKKAGFLTRDARVTESKKYGLKKARKAPQYSKR